MAASSQLLRSFRAVAANQTGEAIIAAQLGHLKGELLWDKVLRYSTCSPIILSSSSRAFGLFMVLSNSAAYALFCWAWARPNFRLSGQRDTRRSLPLAQWKDSRRGYTSACGTGRRAGGHDRLLLDTITRPPVHVIHVVYLRPARSRCADDGWWPAERLGVPRNELSNGSLTLTKCRLC